MVCNNQFPFTKHLRISVVYGLRQVTNIVICGYVMENIYCLQELLSQHPPFSYNCEYKVNLVSISTGVVAPNCANVDCAVELGNNAAVRLVNDNFADVEQKKEEKIKSFLIGAATNNTNIRGYHVEVDIILHFLCESYAPLRNAQLWKVISNTSSVNILFDRGAMKKNDKSVLAHNLKAAVVPIVRSY